MKEEIREASMREKTYDHFFKLILGFINCGWKKKVKDITRELGWIARKNV